MLMEQVQLGDIVKIRKPEAFGSMDFFDADSMQCAFLVKEKGQHACKLTAIDGHGPPRWHGRECEVNPFWLERDEFLTQAWKANKEKHGQ